jgi:hypothetical protein
MLSNNSSRLSFNTISNEQHVQIPYCTWHIRIKILSHLQARHNTVEQKTTRSFVTCCIRSWDVLTLRNDNDEYLAYRTFCSQGKSWDIERPWQCEVMTKGRDKRDTSLHSWTKSDKLVQMSRCPDVSPQLITIPWKHNGHWKTTQDILNFSTALMSA